MDKKKILIIDDDPDFCAYLAALIRHHGYDVIQAGDGVSAMHSAVAEKPDLILLDLGIPAGNGYITLRRIREHPFLAGVPVFIISGKDPDENEGRSYDTGAEVYFEKPCNPEQLLSTIQSTLVPHHV